MTHFPLRRAVSLGIVGFAFVALAGCGSSSSSTTAGANSAAEVALLNAGVNAQNAGNIAEATSDYNQVIAMDPKNKQAFYNLGVIAQQQHRNADADKDYRTALILDPNYEPALYNLALLVDTTNIWESIDLYRHLILLAPNNATYHNNLGYTLKAANQNAEGDAEIAKAKSLGFAGQPASSSPGPASSSSPSPSPS